MNINISKSINKLLKKDEVNINIEVSENCEEIENIIKHINEFDKRKIAVYNGYNIVVIVAIGFGIFKVTHNEDYLYNQDGTVVDGKKDLIESIKKIENAEERKNQINFSVQQNIITQEEANELY